MARYAIVAVSLGLYAALAVWLVQSEGRAYRDRMRTVASPSDSGAARSPARANDMTDAGSPATTNLITTSAASPSQQPSSRSPDSSGSEKGKPKTPVSVTTVPQPNMRADASKGVVPSAETTGDIAAGRHTPETRSDPNRGLSPTQLQLPNDSFLNSPAMKAVWDLSHVTPAEEERLGVALNELVLHYNQALDEDPRVQRLNQVAAPLLAARANKSVSCRFTILDSDLVNAFSHPGGYIYVSRGVFDIVGDDQDYLLEFLLGHEIAHCDLGHAFKCFNDPGVKALGLGTLQEYYLLIAPLAYTDAQEFEADAWVCRQMKRRGCTKRETLGFLRKLDGYAGRHGFLNGRKSPLPGFTAAENHFRAHPATWERLNRVTALYDRP